MCRGAPFLFPTFSEESENTQNSIDDLASVLSYLRVDLIYSTASSSDELSALHCTLQQAGYPHYRRAFDYSFNLRVRISMDQDNMPKDGSPIGSGDVVDPPAIQAEDLDEVDVQVSLTESLNLCFTNTEIHVALKRCLDEAEELKQEGNDHFRAQKWNEALAAYRSALGRIPKRKTTTAAISDKGKGKETLDDLDKEEISGPSRASEVAEEESTPPPVSGLDAECAKARATMNANIGACYVKLVSSMDL